MHAPSALAERLRLILIGFSVAVLLTASAAPASASPPAQVLGCFDVAWPDAAASLRTAAGGQPLPWAATHLMDTYTAEATLLAVGAYGNEPMTAPTAYAVHARRFLADPSWDTGPATRQALVRLADMLDDTRARSDPELGEENCALAQLRQAFRAQPGGLTAYLLYGVLSRNVAPTEQDFLRRYLANLALNASATPEAAMYPEHTPRVVLDGLSLTGS